MSIMTEIPFLIACHDAIESLGEDEETPWVAIAAALLLPLRHHRRRLFLSAVEALFMGDI